MSLISTTLQRVSTGFQTASPARIVTSAVAILGASALAGGAIVGLAFLASPLTVVGLAVGAVLALVVALSILFKVGERSRLVPSREVSSRNQFPDVWSWLKSTVIGTPTLESLFQDWEEVENTHYESRKELLRRGAVDKKTELETQMQNDVNRLQAMATSINNEVLDTVIQSPTFNKLVSELERQEGTEPMDDRERKNNIVEARKRIAGAINGRLAVLRLDQEILDAVERA